MPIYEYHCPRCGTFETIRRITEASLKRCPTCKSKVERMVSRTSFILTGSGWYATDYGRSGSGASSDKSGDKSSGESGAGGSSANGSATAAPSDGGSSDKGGADKTSSSSEKSTTTKSSAKSSD